MSNATQTTDGIEYRVVLAISSYRDRKSETFVTCESSGSLQKFLVAKHSTDEAAQRRYAKLCKMLNDGKVMI